MPISYVRAVLLEAHRLNPACEGLIHCPQGLSLGVAPHIALLLVSPPRSPSLIKFPLPAPAPTPGGEAAQHSRGTVEQFQDLSNHTTPRATM